MTQEGLNVVCYTANAPPPALRDGTKNGCVADESLWGGQL